MTFARIFTWATVAVVAVACKNSPKDYVALSGHIKHKNSDSLIVRTRTFRKKIDVDKEGNFNDTLKVKKGNYVLFDGKEQAYLYLQNGDDLRITLNTSNFDESLVFEGKGSEANNYLAEKTRVRQGLFYDFSIYELEKEAFDQKIDLGFQNLQAILEHSTNLDQDFILQEKTEIQQLKKSLYSNHEDHHYMKTILAKGNASPDFKDYKNYQGGKTSLSDLKGKYVYIDVWATWCGPCKAEIPYLKEVQNEYREKNIEFVSISVDKQKDTEKWMAMIKEKDLKGLQLIADNDFNSEFVQKYAIRGIPRFILLDTEGNIIDANAPRPSNTELKTLFDSLSI